ncbi:MAG: OmpA family protein [Rhodospirillales bacterium]|jgi:outer membrane protein OmpA-like peptidoglycan-associated protein|nr:OmpA family protein [Rhodospirillales bacterium]MDP6883799.1 OmpA family protein [Rhodospirillales bacterium]
MKYPSKVIFSALAVMALSACAGQELGKARGIDATGSAFDKALYSGYLSLSEGEYKEGDYTDSDAFAKRAMTAAGGKVVLPEEVSARPLPSGSVGALTDARARLASAFQKGAIEKMPNEAATAQVMFDCWMQEQEENFQPEDIAACRADLLGALGKIEDALRPKKMAAKPAPMPAPKPKPAPKKMAKIPGPFVVMFDFNSAKLDSAAQAVINVVSGEASAFKPTRIVIRGHTDRAGNDAYNEKLSQRRAEAVAKALAAAGTKAKSVAVSHHGETQPEVSSGDGKREAANRRVEIGFQR